MTLDGCADAKLWLMGRSCEAFTTAVMQARLLPVAIRSLGTALEAKSRDRNCVSEKQCLLTQSQPDRLSCNGHGTWIHDGRC